MEKTIFMGLVIGAIAIAMVAAGSSSVIPVSAGKDSASKGLERADENVHENTDSGNTQETLSEQDVRFHQGTCQGGHETEAVGELFENGCDDIPPPGNSGDNRQDD